MQVAIVDPDGAIVCTNDAWRDYGEWDGVTEVGDPVGRNYVRVCRTDAIAADDGDPRTADGGVAVRDETAELDGGAVADGIEAVLAGDRETFEHEYPCHSSEERRWFLMRAVGVEYEGRPHAQVVHVDITDRKLAEETVVSRNDRLETLAGVLAHDLRNPLNVVQGRTQLLAERLGDAVGPNNEDNEDGDSGDEDGDASAVASDLSSLRASADRIEAIIGDALQLARGGFSAEEPASEVALREAAVSAWGHVPAAEATLEVRDSFTFEAQSGPLGQVFENLLANAVEHASETVTVAVGTLGDSDPSGFYVADDGPGIAPEDRATVFEPGHTSADDGTGLGLAIVEQFVESQGWHVTVVESVEAGARFEVRGVEAT